MIAPLRYTELLELEPQGELDQARAAQGPGGGRHGPRLDGTSYCLRDFAEVGVAHVPNGVGEVGMVEEIEKVRSELQSRPFP